MRLVDALDDVFRGRSHILVLRALLRLPEGIDASIREIGRRAGVTHPTASGVLKSLRTQGLVLRRGTRLADEYRINRSHVLVEPLRTLLAAEADVTSSLERSLADLMLDRAPWVRAAYLFGSAVDGSMDPGSDIDVAVLCPPRRARDLTQIMEEISEEIVERFGNRLDVLIGTATLRQLSQPGRTGSRIWQDVTKNGRRIIPPGED